MNTEQKTSSKAFTLTTSEKTTVDKFFSEFMQDGKTQAEMLLELIRTYQHNSTQDITIDTTQEQNEINNYLRLAEKAMESAIIKAKEQIKKERELSKTGYAVLDSEKEQANKTIQELQEELKATKAELDEYKTKYKEYENQLLDLKKALTQNNELIQMLKNIEQTKQTDKVNNTVKAEKIEKIVATEQAEKVENIEETKETKKTANPKKTTETTTTTRKVTKTRKPTKIKK